MHHRFYGCSKSHISLVIEILLKEELIVGLSLCSTKEDKSECASKKQKDTNNEVT